MNMKDSNTEPTGLPEIQAPVLPAAAQEAVAWQVGDDFYTSESLAIEGIQQWGPSGSIAIPLYAAPVAAAPVVPVDSDAFAYLVDEVAAEHGEMLDDGGPSGWSFTCEDLVAFAKHLMSGYKGALVADAYAIARSEAKRDSTPAAPGIDLEQFHEAVGVYRDEVRAMGYADGIKGAVRLLALIDASPKGGSTDAEPKIWGTQKPGSMPKLFGARHIAELNWYPGEGYDLLCMQVIERVQATSAEVKS